MTRWAKGEPYIRLANGTKVSVGNPKPDDYRNVPLIARHLAGINRYSGGSRFTVAQHMVVGARMAELFYPDNALLPARFMIHDMGEGLVGDMSTPLKHQCPDFKAIETKHDLAVEARCDLTFLGDPLVKELDNRMWLTEREMFYMDVPDEIDISEDTAHLELEPFDLPFHDFLDAFGPWEPSFAEEQYLIEFRRLLPWTVW